MEARAAESRRDFISKCSIGLKELREAFVRLRICERTGIGPKDQVTSPRTEAEELISIVTAIIRNTRRHSANS